MKYKIVDAGNGDAAIAQDAAEIAAYLEGMPLREALRTYDAHPGPEGWVWQAEDGCCEVPEAYIRLADILAPVE